MEDGFDSINQLQNLDFIVGNSAQDVLDQIRAIHLPTRLISVYSQGTRHYAWIQTHAKLKKIKQNLKEGK